jgi:hypothetical protein
MDDDMQAMEVRDREIERRLEAFARARLSPDREVVARTRARVMREARLQFEASRIAAHMAPAFVLVPRRTMARRLAMPVLAASVWLGIAVGSISAATAGGPLYPTRMWIENAILPADGLSRANAEINRLDDRLAEAVAGAARGDAGAVEAALDAYSQISDEALAAAGGDATLEALVAAALDSHRAVLAAVDAALEAKGNDAATAAVEASIERAIDHSQSVVDRLDANGAGGGAGSSNGSGTSGPTGGGSGAGTGTGSGTGTSGGGAGTGTGGGDKPARTPKPTPTPTPTPTPKPTPELPAPSPDKQGQPDHAPHAQSH